MALHDPDLVKAHAHNRLAIAAARQEAVLALRAEGAAERKALATRMADEAKAEGRQFDIDAYTSACRQIDNEYGRRETEQFGLPVGAVRDGRIDRPEKPNLRLWGRV